MTTTEPRLRAILREVSSALEQAGVAHALVGGLAMAAHGFPRATKDLDFMLAHLDARAADDVLRRLGFEAASDAGGFVRYVRRPLPNLPELVEWVDILLARRAIGLELLAEAQRTPIRWHGMEVPVVSLEGIVAMKLLALVDNPRRLNDRDDVLTLLRSIPGPNLARVRAAAETLGPDAVAMFESLARESRDEIREPRSADFGL